VGRIAGKKLEHLHAIIGSCSVVIDDFFRKKGTTEVLRHDLSMFEYAALALIDTKLIRKLRTSADPLHALPTGSTLDDLFALIPRAAIVGICQLSRRFQSTTGREWLTRPVSFDPSVWVGNIGASPDLLVGDCLLDLKTSLHPSLERVWLDQLLVYTLVVGDLKKIKRLRSRSDCARSSSQALPPQLEGGCSAERRQGDAEL
jgi:hypothetical protein